MMNSPDPRLDPRAQGARDFIQGKAHCDSPYPVDSADYWEWHVGFYAAADEAIENGEHVSRDRL